MKIGGMCVVLIRCDAVASKDNWGRGEGVSSDGGCRVDPTQVKTSSNAQKSGFFIFPSQPGALLTSHVSICASMHPSTCQIDPAGVASRDKTGTTLRSVNFPGFRLFSRIIPSR